MRTTNAFLLERCETVPVQFPAVLSWDYEHQDAKLARLYDKAKRSQWNAATDIDWSFGQGQEVTGPGEALLMTIAGRPDPLHELSGPGLTTLRQRVA